MDTPFRKYFDAISEFGKSSFVTQGNTDEFLRNITRKIAHMMDLNICSVWEFAPDKDAIIGRCFYDRDKDQFSFGQILSKKDCPKYFSLLNEERVLIVKDTFKHPATLEFEHSHLIPYNIHALIDSPIFFDGSMIGIFCCEKKETPRDWGDADEALVVSCADFIGRAYEAQKRKEYERELKEIISSLEAKGRSSWQELEEAKQSLDLAMEGAQLAKWDWDIPTGKLFLNEKWSNRLGYSSGELLPVLKTWQNIVHPDDFDRVYRILMDHVEGITPHYEAKYRMIQKDGKIQWVLDRGKVLKYDENRNPLRVSGVHFDVTDSVHFEENLKHSQNQLINMIKSLPVPVVMVDKNFIIIASSAEYKSEYVPVVDIVLEGKHVTDIFPNIESMWPDRLREGMKGKTLYKDEELIKRTLRQDFSWVTWKIVPWNDINGEVGGVILILENISKRKETVNQLRQAAKFSALGEMAAGIAHEINNPISILQGHIDLLKNMVAQNILDKQKLENFITKSQTTVERVTKIVNGMRRLSKHQANEDFQEYSLNLLLDECLDFIQEKFKTSLVELQIKRPQGELFITIRPTEVSQILLNLLNNAFQAIHRSSRPWVKLECSIVEGLVRIAVTDSGTGIPADTRDRIFEPFFTTKSSDSGTGLGLSISRRIAEAHGGRLFYDESSQNTCLVMELPLVWRC